jgi:hypothetical protein
MEKSSQNKPAPKATKVAWIAFASLYWLTTYLLVRVLVHALHWQTSGPFLEATFAASWAVSVAKAVRRR